MVLLAGFGLQGPEASCGEKSAPRRGKIPRGGSAAGGARRFGFLVWRAARLVPWGGLKVGPPRGAPCFFFFFFFFFSPLFFSGFSSFAFFFVFRFGGGMTLEKRQVLIQALRKDDVPM